MSAKYFDMGDLACLIAPRQLFISACDKERPIFFNKRCKQAFVTIKEIYKKRKRRKNANLLIYEGKDHYFNVEKNWAKIMQIIKFDLK